MIAEFFRRGIEPPGPPAGLEQTITELRTARAARWEAEAKGKRRRRKIVTDENQGDLLQELGL
jgi:hypothetical protein